MGAWCRIETRPRRLWSRARFSTIERRYATCLVSSLDSTERPAQPDERFLDEVFGRVPVHHEEPGHAHELGGVGAKEARDDAIALLGVPTHWH